MTTAKVGMSSGDGEPGSAGEYSELMKKVSRRSASGTASALSSADIVTR